MLLSAFSLAIALSLLLPAKPALALIEDWIRESGSDYRGVGADIWVYRWTLVNANPKGNHVSTVYIHRPDNFIHVEMGVRKWYGETSGRAFWQYNQNPNLPPGHEDNNSWDMGYGASMVNDAYVWCELNNIDMGGAGDPGDTWRWAWGGNTLKQLYMPGLIAGRAQAASGRLYERNDAPDDNRSSFRNLKKKNNAGSWSLWAGTSGLLDQDDYYFWGNYSISHFYHHDPPG